MILVTKTSDQARQRGHARSTCTIRMYVCMMYVCIYVCMYVCSYVCLYVFIKLHITTQSGPVILVILCHSH